METSTSRTAEKKDKMDGNGFADLPKKPPETRGNAPSPEQQLYRNVVSSFVSVGGGVGGAELRSCRCSAGGQRGGANTDDEIYISKAEVPSREPMYAALLGLHKVPAAAAAVRGDLQ